MQRFGGEWTEEKLKIVEAYLGAHLSALKKQRFSLGYVDAFAGTGYSSTGRKTANDEQTNLAFGDAFDEPAESFLKGSAIRALELDPPFHWYAFIDSSARKLAELRTAAEKVAPTLVVQDRIYFWPEEANKAIRTMCSEWDTKTVRAVMFLDPFGMQVEWPTIEAIARTKSIDLWLLFPIAMGANRMLKKDGRLPDEWARRITTTLGTDEWRKDFYAETTQPCLFGGESVERTANYEAVQRYFNQRLTSIFAVVAPNPRILRNSQGSPLYGLCFAAGNERGAEIAVKIAKHILDRISVVSQRFVVHLA